MTSKGAQRKGSDNSEAANLDELGWLSRTLKNQAQKLMNRLIRYLKKNPEKFGSFLGNQKRASCCGQLECDCKCGNRSNNAGIAGLNTCTGKKKQTSCCDPVRPMPQKEIEWQHVESKKEDSPCGCPEDRDKGYSRKKSRKAGNVRKRVLW